MPGTDPTTDIVYGLRSWSNRFDVENVPCGGPGDVNFFTNVTAVADFIRPYLPNTTTAMQSPLAEGG